MSVILQKFHNYEDIELTNHAIGNILTHQVSFRNRRIPRPSFHLMCTVWALCITFLFIITAILIVTVNGRSEKNIEVGLRNLSQGMQSRVERLSQDDYQTLEKLTVVETSLKDLKGSLSVDYQRILGDVGKLPKEIQKGISQGLDEIKEDMEVKFKKLNSVLQQMSQDDSSVMEKFSAMETSIKDLNDSKVTEKLFALETSIKDLKGPLSKDVPMAVEAVSKQAEEMQKLKGSLSRDIQKILEVVGKYPEEIQKINPSKVLNKVTEIESSVKRILSDDVKGSLSSDIQKVLGSVEKLAQEIQKGKKSSELCAPGWINFGGSCYYWSSRLLQWKNAKEDCEGRKAHLVVVNGNEEMVYIRAFSQKKLWWIGLIETDGNWEWVDGTSYEITPKFWEAGQPDDYLGHTLRGGEDCAQLRNADGWNDAHCSSKHLYICEKKIS
ncbi:uncharacterized protein [Pyxicephalus adspersus]|uniref:uncharacterized protein n=1 Tax=Pyxicephalus adspersus TaxID=30357 RepID=UPI003B5CDBCA